jgi:hypothetical protein
VVEPLSHFAAVSSEPCSSRTGSAYWDSSFTRIPHRHGGWPTLAPKQKGAIGIAIAAAVLALSAWSVYRNWSLSKGFEQIAIGDSRERVLHVLGRPKRRERCGEPFGNPGGKPDCHEDYLYASPYAPLIPKYWSVSFNNQGIVIDKYHYVSP